jgi:DNA polymerase-3 subunit beta
MKISVPTQLLVEGVGHSAMVAASKSPKPILECVAVRADATTGVSLEATDLDVGIRYHLADASVDVAGSLVVPAGRLLSIVREVDEEETTLEGEGGNLSVDTGRSQFRVRGENAEEFARLPFFPEKEAATVPADLLHGLVRRTRFATATDAGRYALHGVLLVITKKGIELVATDGRRLARATAPLKGGIKQDLRVIVGPKGLALLERVLGASGGAVSIAVQDRQILFRSGGVLIVSRLIDGTFPAYEDVIPKSTPHEFRVTVADLMAGLRRASLLTTRDALSVELLVDPGDGPDEDGERSGNITIRSRAVEVGEAKISVPVSYDGPPAKLGFNPVFLQDALKIMDPAAEVRFAFSDAKAPVIMSDGDDYTYVVMPVALE